MTKLSATLLLLLLSVSTLVGQVAHNHESPVRLSETYELANIILALTDYGKTDPWEVSQQSDYYREVRAYFEPFSTHPLLTTVNYSRQQWESYLSFRTDAYAFVFDSGHHLVRQVAFVANQGFNPFEEHLSLIEDFARQTDFRAFYRRHLPYYQELANAYLASQHYPDMIHFLETELGKRPNISSYAIVLSPLVGRMNCHRMVAGVGTDFITLPNFLLSGKVVQTASQEEIAAGTHMLFTELDHAFVNPLSDQYSALLKANFPNKLWDAGSGYEVDSLASFNEYMTWAVYDLFVAHYFLTVAAKVSTDWAMQNETRGFYASSLFNKELSTLYKRRKAGQTLRNLYPTFIKHLGKLQHHLHQPTIKSCSLIGKTQQDSLTTYTLHFSDPMQSLPTLDLIRVSGEKGKQVQEHLVLTPQNNDLSWSANGMELRFRLNTRQGIASKLILNYAWKTSIPLRSRYGINLAPYTQLTCSN